MTDKALGAGAVAPRVRGLFDELLERLARHFRGDEGVEPELAVTVRVLVRGDSSVVRQVGLHELHVHDSARRELLDFDPRGRSLVQRHPTLFLDGQGSYEALGGPFQETPLVPLDSWLHEPLFTTQAPSLKTWSRWSFIDAFANKDGGAHVDPEGSRLTVALEAAHVPEVHEEPGTTRLARVFMQESLRQIAQELLVTLAEQRSQHLLRTGLAVRRVESSAGEGEARGRTS